MTLHPASERQMLAADPSQSTWLSANAGSGKTKVLTDRVARLLLSGTEPQRILCLTYTKAAAAEMQNRLFRRLGEWAMMPEDRLYAALMDLGLPQAPDEATLKSARRLFARAIETPGGLKIQTIHSFCASLLRRFPLEAQVSPGFQEMDDRSGKMLRQEILEDLAETRAPHVITRLASIYTGEDFLGIAQDVASKRAHFTPEVRADLPALLGVTAGDSLDRLMGDVFDGTESQWLGQVIAHLMKSGTNDSKAAAKLAALNLDSPSLGDLAILEDVLLTGAKTKSPFSAKIGSFPTKAGRALIGTLVEPLEDLMARVEEARARRVGLAALAKAEALHDFAAHFLPQYEARKQARGWLDFDDLIQRAKGLLSDSSVAQWVLYRLDGGIDHILVDEAQDTGPDQWRVIELLAQEFTAGQGARDNPRTIFVVGDKKQSIYSFQGADLEKFDAMQAHFAEGLAANGTGLGALQLEYSFRSAPAVLQAVDATATPFTSLGQVKHIAFNTDMPGRVDLWPPVAAEEAPEPGDWFDPVDLPSPRAPEVILAETVARHIAELLAAGTQLPTRHGARPMRAGDVLILVQRRNKLFHEIIRACKAANLPIAGADRLKLGAEIAVKDITALLSFLATPEDDLSLATALRSPLFGWDEQRLFDLAQGRKGYLWEALRHREDHEPTLITLRDLRDKSDFLRPFELIERVLTRHDGRRRLIARLGAEAEDGIDQYLSQALAYERLEVPSLTGFLTWLSTDEVEVKRQADAAGDRIRVMTVHGSKGLEAPVVYLPDTGDRRSPTGDDTAMLPGDVPVWRASEAESPAALLESREIMLRGWEEENQRLLYVAMTRAESWLIAAAAGKAEKENSWHAAMMNGLLAAGATPLETPTGEGLRLASGHWPENGAVAAASVQATEVMPDWARSRAPTPERPPQPITPSGLGGAKALPGEMGLPEDQAKARGTALHLLLERLPDYPAVQWPAMAASIEGADDSLLAEATAVLSNPELRFLFTAEALPEVEFTATHKGRKLHGAIDRLVIFDDHILAVDFKSNAVVPRSPAQVPEGLLRQMGAYATALAQIYPDKPIRTAFLWTASAQLMVLPPKLTQEAFEAAPLP